jgi:hypothetical protein
MKLLAMLQYAADRALASVSRYHTTRPDDRT